MAARGAQQEYTDISIFASASHRVVSVGVWFLVQTNAARGRINIKKCTWIASGATLRLLSRPLHLAIIVVVVDYDLLDVLWSLLLLSILQHIDRGGDEQEGVILAGVLSFCSCHLNFSLYPCSVLDYIFACWILLGRRPRNFTSKLE